MGTEASRELTLPGSQSVLKLLLVTGMDKIEDTVSDQLKLGGGKQEGVLQEKLFFFFLLFKGSNQSYSCWPTPQLTATPDPQPTE